MGSMADSLWNSYARMARLSRRARTTAIVSAVISACGWLWPSLVVGSLGAIVGTFAVTIALFTSFRAQDLAGGPPPRV